MLSMLEWSMVWKHRPDPEYAVDLNVHAALMRLSTKGLAIDDTCLEQIAILSGHSSGECHKSFLRMIWSGVLKRTYFDPPKPSVYRLTQKPVKRTPLGGKRFHGPTPPWDGRWKANRLVDTMRGRTASFEAAAASPHSIFGNDLRGRQQIMAPDETAPFDIEELVSQLRPEVAAFCQYLSDGASIEDASKEAGLSARQVKRTLPKLRKILSAMMRRKPP